MVFGSLDITGQTGDTNFAIYGKLMPSTDTITPITVIRTVTKKMMIMITTMVRMMTVIRIMTMIMMLVMRTVPVMMMMSFLL